jgi:hypothetical protein
MGPQPKTFVVVGVAEACRVAGVEAGVAAAVAAVVEADAAPESGVAAAAVAPEVLLAAVPGEACVLVVLEADEAGAGVAAGCADDDEAMVMAGTIPKSRSTRSTEIPRL